MHPNCAKREYPTTKCEYLMNIACVVVWQISFLAHLLELVNDGIPALALDWRILSWFYGRVEEAGMAVERMKKVIKAMDVFTRHVPPFLPTRNQASNFGLYLITKTSCITTGWRTVHWFVDIAKNCRHTWRATARPNNVKRRPRQRYSTLEATSLEQANSVNAMQNTTFNPDEWVVRADSFPDDEEFPGLVARSEPSTADI